MKYLLFLGCVIPTKQYAYEISVRKVLPRLGVELVDFNDVGCCGFPLKSLNKKAWIYMSARILSIAAKRGLPILALCNGCDVSLREVKHILEEDPALREEIGNLLKKEGIELNTNVEVRHTVDLLLEVIGLERIKKAVVRPLKGLKIAPFPGCHIIRPTEIKRPEDPAKLDSFDKILKVLGAEAGYYPGKGSCCGATMLPFAPRDALRLASETVRRIIDWGFDAGVTSCPYCMEVLDAKQDAMKNVVKDPSLSLPMFYLTQLIGIAMGLKPSELGIRLNMSPIEDVLTKIGVDPYE